MFDITPTPTQVTILCTLLLFVTQVILLFMISNLSIRRKKIKRETLYQYTIDIITVLKGQEGSRTNKIAALLDKYERRINDEIAGE